MSTGLGDRALCGTLLHLGSAPADTVYGPFRIDTFLELSSRNPMVVLCHGDVGGEVPLLARVHSSCMTSESFGGCDCDCAGQLDAALRAIAAAGRGAIFYLLQEGRGAGFVAKARDRMMVQASRDRVTTFDAYARMGLGRDYRRYDSVAFAAAALGIGAPLDLLTNNPDKVAALQLANVSVARVIPLARPASPFNRHYLAAKSRSGHALDAPAADTDGGAALPEAITSFEPHPLAQRPRFIRVASYLLPIRAGAIVHWFRLHAYFDLVAQRERVVFTYAHDAAALPLVGRQCEGLLARFPLRARPRHAQWLETVQRITRRGAGAVLFSLHDDPAIAAGAVDDDQVWLLAHHVPQRRAELLREGPEASAGERALRARLASHHVECSS